MIFDSIENAKAYKGISKNLDTAIDYIISTDFSGLDEQTVEVDRRDVYAMIQKYSTEAADEREYEAHRKYIDLQLVVSGYETMICRSVEGLVETMTYDEDKDAALYALSPANAADEPDLAFGGGTEVRLKAGDYAVFFPQDAHVPKIMSAVPTEVLKVVVKVKV
ncbi:MAG: YhcH/YjgK/YiaL family protein [Spirochaetales bacterium]|jgi:biofilm protein TabA|nr:YhcH/YjgK/YiaL family protein [Spirochaetales bacterium]